MARISAKAARRLMLILAVMNTSLLPIVIVGCQLLNKIVQVTVMSSYVALRKADVIDLNRLAVFQGGELRDDDMRKVPGFLLAGSTTRHTHLATLVAVILGINSVCFWWMAFRFPTPREATG